MPLRFGIHKRSIHICIVFASHINVRMRRTSFSPIKRNILVAAIFKGIHYTTPTPKTAVSQANTKRTYNPTIINHSKIGANRFWGFVFISLCVIVYQHFWLVGSLLSLHKFPFASQSNM